MARKPRIHFPGAFYHCINRGNQRKQIYFSDDDFLFMLDALANVSGKFGALIHAYCLMHNHFHLLLQVQEIPLHTILRSLLTAYARYFNRTHHKTGHVFQGRYRGILCQKENYLLELVRYIHLNPLRARLVENPTQWRWSSLNDCLHPGQHSWLYTNDVLTLFGNNPRFRLASFLSQASNLDPALIYPPESFPILGDDGFTKRAADPIALRRHNTRIWPGQRFSLEELAQVLSRQMRLLPSALNLRHKGSRNLSTLRESIVYVALQYGFYHNAQLAQFLHISSSSVSTLYQNFLKKMSISPMIESSLLQSLKREFLNI
jgi:REP element-mobilizing transposase RayT